MSRVSRATDLAWWVVSLVVGSPRSFLAFALAAAVVFGVSATSAAAEDGRAPQPSILTILSGTVFVRHGSAPLAAATDGEVLAVGDVVQTTDDAHAIVTMFEGSTIEIEPSTLITIDDASTREASTFIQLTQLFGRTWHVVTHLLTADSRYDVRTPAATASVRGTVFEVAILEADGVTPGTTTVTTVKGAVATSDRDGTHEVLVTPATTTTVVPGSAPTELRPAPDVTHVAPVKGAGADAPGKTDSSVKPDASGKADASGNADASSKSGDGKGSDGSSVSTGGSAERGVSAARPESGGNVRTEGNANASTHESEKAQRSEAAASEAKPQRGPSEAASHGDSAVRASVVPTFSLPTLPSSVAEGPKTNANEHAKTNSDQKPSAIEMANAPEKPSASEHRAEPVAPARTNDHDKAGDQGRRR
jgi:hypothetical protein